jgi:mannitol/fructose-specific phosphotransferase system IIA component (Ntr-type)
MRRLSELLDAGHVALDLAADDVPGLLQTLVDLLVTHQQVPTAVAGELLAALLERERLGGTCVGQGVAVPHAYLAKIQAPALLLARLQQPIAYCESTDGRPVDLVFMLTGPQSAQLAHIQVIARIVRLLHDGGWLAALRQARSAEEVLEAVRAVEKRHV